jgi:hypothetical protein
MYPVRAELWVLEEALTKLGHFCPLLQSNGPCLSKFSRQVAAAELEILICRGSKDGAGKFFPFLKLKKTSKGFLGQAIAK